MRWYRLLMRLFPSSHLASQSGEMLDSLEKVPTTSRSRLTETGSILHASVGSWVRHSRTPQGVRGAAFFGAFVWLAFIIGIGPIRRARYEIEGLGGAADGMTSAHFFVPAAVVLVIAMTLLVWTRAGAAIVGAVGIGLAAASNRVGDFHNFDSTIYEGRWLGLALLVAIALHPGKRRWLAAVTAAVAASLSAAIAAPSAFWSTRNYGQGIRWDLTEVIDRSYPAPASHVVPIRSTAESPLSALESAELALASAQSALESGELTAYTGQRHYWGLQLMDIIVLVAILFLLLAPWFAPALAAIIVPIAAHWAFIEPFPAQLVLLAYVCAVIYLRLRYEQRSPRPAPIT